MDISKILKIGEKQYRSLPYDSYSSIKDFISSRLKYYKKYILKEKGKDDDTKEQDSDDMRFGNIVDCLKFTPDDFESRYQISSAEIPDSPQMIKFVKELIKLCIINTNDMGVLCGNLELLIEEAYNNTGIKQTKIDAWKEKFLIKKEGYDYFLELKDRKDRIIISPAELEWAQSIKDYMTNHPHVRDIMNCSSNDDYEVFDQIMLKGVINDVEVKMMGDRVILNKKKKLITPFDLKVMSNIEMFPYNYLKLKYYVQNGVYTTLLRQNFPEYEIPPIKFVTIDKYRQCEPTIVKTSEKQYQQAMNGFSINGRKYKGVNEALEEMKWHKEKGIWTSPKEIIDNNGFIDLILDNVDSE